MRKSTLFITLGICLVACQALFPAAAWVACHFMPHKYTSEVAIEAADSQKPAGFGPQSGTSFLVRLNPPADENGKIKTITPEMVDQAVQAFRKRMAPYGVSAPIITPQGTGSILVQVPGLHDAAQVADASKQLEQVAKLEFKLVLPDSAALVKEIEAGQAVIPPGYTLKTFSEDRNGKTHEEKLLVKDKSDLDGTHLKEAAAIHDPGGWGVEMKFDSQGAEDFAEITKQAAQEHSQMAIELDGKVISAASVDSHYAETGITGGDAQISGGGMDPKSARDLSIALENPLQTPVVIEETRSMSGGADRHFIPSSPNVRLTMMVAAGVGLICVLCGFGLILMGLHFKRLEATSST